MCCQVQLDHALQGGVEQDETYKDTNLKAWLCVDEERQHCGEEAFLVRRESTLKESFLASQNR